jgi:hypothetical protein
MTLEPFDDQILKHALLSGVGCCLPKARAGGTGTERSADLSYAAVKSNKMSHLFIIGVDIISVLRSVHSGPSIPAPKNFRRLLNILQK